MIPGYQSLYPPELAQRWVNDLGTRPKHEHKSGTQSHDMRMFCRIVRARSAEQSVGITTQTHRKEKDIMAKKFGKFVLFTAAATVAAAATYRFYQKKASELDFDEDFDIPESLIDKEEESIQVPQNATEEGSPEAEPAKEETPGEETAADSSSDFTPLSEGSSDSSFENAGEVKENEEQFF